jgi:hypothetical protein
MQLSRFSGRWGRKTLLIIGVLFIGFAARQAIFRQFGLGQSAQAQSNSDRWNGAGATPPPSTTYPTPAEAFQSAVAQYYPNNNNYHPTNNHVAQYKTTAQYPGNPVAQHPGNPYPSVGMREARPGYPGGHYADASQTASFTPQALRVLDELRNTPESQREPSKLDTLREELQRQFQSTHASQLRRLEQIMASAEQSKQILERRAAQRDAIVERRMAELLGQRDALAWDFALDQGMNPGLSNSGPSNGLAFPFSPPVNSPRAPVGPNTPAVNIAPSLQPVAPPASLSQPPAYQKSEGPSNRFSFDAERKQVEALDRRLQADTTAFQEAAQLAQLKRQSGMEAGRLSDLETEAKPAQRPNLSTNLAPSDLKKHMVIGNWVMHLKQRLPTVEQSFNDGQASPDELSQTRSELALAEAQWRYVRILQERDLRLQELTLENARTELSSVKDWLSHASTSKDSSEAVKQQKVELQNRLEIATSAVERAEFELDAAQQHARMLQELNTRIQAMDKSVQDKSVQDKSVQDKSAVDKQPVKQQADTRRAASAPAIQPSGPLSTDAQNQGSNPNDPPTDQESKADANPIPE